MRLTLRCILGGLLMLGTLGTAIVPASAYVSNAGHEYELQCSRDGYELKSSYPVSRMVGIGADSRWVRERESIYLGRSCDAYLKTYGYGEWCWANGGFGLLPVSWTLACCRFFGHSVKLT